MNLIIKIKHIKKLAVICSAIALSANVIYSAGILGYYSGVNNKTGNELKIALHDLIKNHKTVSYDSLWEHYKNTDVRENGKPWCIYSDYPFRSFIQNQGGPPGRIGSYLTREHSWPKQWWGGANNSAYSDLFHVILADAHTNGQKGVKPLGEVGTEFDEWLISKTGFAREGLGYEGEVFEPADNYKGDFARGYLYFAVQYLAGNNPLDCSVSAMIQDNGIDFEPWAINLLLSWHKSDPVSEREIKRNNEIYKIQRNRNPFIDHPEYADLVWGAQLSIGVDANYSLEMIDSGKTWGSDGSNGLFRILAERGVDSFRLRLWTCESGPGSLDNVLKLAGECKKNNINPYVVMFLSDNWADYVKQPVPEKWSAISFDDKIEAVRKYSRSIAAAFLGKGIKPAMYEIGNEIDFGICGEFENEWHRRFDIEYMKKNIWIKAARIIAASQAGILEEDKNAKFILHLTQWWNPEFCIEFYDFMLSHNVRIDFLGLSFFPTSTMSEKNDLDYFESQIKKLSEPLGKPVIICEYAYPSAKDFKGQFAEWNKGVKGYGLDENGQMKWIKDFLNLCRKNKYIRGAYYWSPEWYDSEMWEAFSLFDSKGSPKKGLKNFK